MKFDGFCGPAYLNQNIDAEYQRCVNWYVEVNESRSTKEKAVTQLVPTPGLRSILTGLAGPVRGLYVTSTGVPYVVAGFSLYKLNSDLTVTEIYSTLGGIDPVQMVDNGFNLFVLSANRLTTHDLSNGFSEIHLDREYTALDYINSRVVLSEKSSNRFWWTDLLSTVIDPLNFASAEASPDEIVGLRVNNNDLWIGNTRTVEVWRNEVNGDTIFQQVEGATIQSGLASPNSFCRIGNTLSWLSLDDKGSPLVMQSVGVTAKRVSTHSIERDLAKNYTEAQWKTASAFSFREGSHAFYALNIGQDKSTWVFDESSSAQLGMACWHERRSTKTNGFQDRWLADCHMFAYGIHIVGSYKEGVLYALDPDTLRDGPRQILRERTTPHISNEGKQVIHDRLHLDVLTGTGDIAKNAVITMEYSDDNGKTWSDPWAIETGAGGDFEQLVEWRGLGVSRKRIYRITASEPQQWYVTSASLDVRPMRW